MSERPNLIEAFGLGRRAVCRLCGLAFRIAGHDPEICPDCVEFEPGPFQDNDPPGDMLWHGPLLAPEIAVAQEARAEAEACARDAFSAAVFLHEALTAIAGNPGRAHKLFPRDQVKRAQHALELFAENFPDLIEAMDALPMIDESAKLN
jgi:hypothetical protein